jgi:hypothetical protein
MMAPFLVGDTKLLVVYSELVVHHNDFGRGFVPAACRDHASGDRDVAGRPVQERAVPARQEVVQAAARV